MLYIQSDITDPYWNLALEQYVFDRLDRAHSYFMLWQNHNSIIVGKHQNTAGEVNAAFVNEHGITVARRLSGGGAVYHDMGNLNFTFIADGDGSFNFATFCTPVIRALATLGVEAELSGRNDMTIDGKKFSGNSQYRKQGRVMHHGTILYDSDLTMIGGALNVSKDKIESKGIRSVRSRVTNIRPYMAENVPIDVFRDALRDYMFHGGDMGTYTLTEKDRGHIRELRDGVYAKWEWNFGASPAHTIQKKRRVEGCGTLEVYMDVGKDGILEDISFYGDYFGNADSSALSKSLRGVRLEESALRSALAGVEIGAYFGALDLETFLSILLQ